MYLQSKNLTNLYPTLPHLSANPSTFIFLSYFILFF